MKTEKQERYCGMGWGLTMAVGVGLLIGSPMLVLGGSMLTMYWLFITGKFLMVCAPAIIILGTVYWSARAMSSVRHAWWVGVVAAYIVGYGLWYWAGDAVRAGLSA